MPNKCLTSTLMRFFSGLRLLFIWKINTIKCVHWPLQSKCFISLLECLRFPFFGAFIALSSISRASFLGGVSLNCNCTVGSGTLNRKFKQIQVKWIFKIEDTNESVLVWVCGIWPCAALFRFVQFLVRHSAFHRIWLARKCRLKKNSEIWICSNKIHTLHWKPAQLTCIDILMCTIWLD